MPLVELPRVIAARPDRPDVGGADHPMRRVTREIASGPEGWSPARAAMVNGLFESLSETWGDRDRTERHDALRDALDRGGPFPRGLCLEVGSGTGTATGDLVAGFDRVVAGDLSSAMLRRATVAAPRVRFDAARLPVVDGAVAVLALVNMFLFPAEVDRVLAPGGVLLWVSTNGDATPIYLPPAEVVAALPGEWLGVAAEAGWGRWATVRRR